jgi:hypothetical protein
LAEPDPRPGAKPSKPDVLAHRLRYEVRELSLSLRTSRMTRSSPTPPTRASRGPKPVGAISSPPSTVAVGVGVGPPGVGVGTTAVGEPSSTTLVGVAPSCGGVEVATTVGGLVAVGATVGLGVKVASATTVGEGLGAKNLVYTTRPAMAKRPIISKPTRPITTIMKSLLCPPLGLVIFSLPPRQADVAPSSLEPSPKSTSQIAHWPPAHYGKLDRIQSYQASSPS